MTPCSSACGSTAWSGRLYDRQASQQVAIHNDADTSAGRYNKRLLPKQAFAALAATMSNARTSHYANTLPWDDQGGPPAHRRQLRPLHRRSGHIGRARGAGTRPLHRGLRRLRRPGPPRPRPAVPASRTTPPRTRSRDRFSIRLQDRPGPRRATISWPKLASGRRPTGSSGISSNRSGTRLNDAVSDLYRRLGEAVEHVGESACARTESGKPLVFRDSLIENIREPGGRGTPRLNIFGDDHLAMLCQRGQGPDGGRRSGYAADPSRQFDPAIVRRQVKRDADANSRPGSPATSRHRPPTDREAA